MLKLLLYLFKVWFKIITHEDDYHYDDGDYVTVDVVDDDNVNKRLSMNSNKQKRRRRRRKKSLFSIQKPYLSLESSFYLILNNCFCSLSK